MTDESVFIRRLCPDSATVLRDLRALVDAEGTLGSLAERERALRPESIEAQLRPPFETFGAFVEKNLVGSASLSKMSDCPIEPDGEVWYAISAVIVHPGFRKRGIGKALVKICISCAEQNRANGILLVVNVPNSARALYESLGFTAGEVVEGAYEYQGQRRDQVSMRLRL